MTAAKKQILATLRTIANIKILPNEAKIAGINLEGPFISPDRKGAHDERFMLKPNLKDATDFVKASHNKIRIMTIAVEKLDNKLANYLYRNNIVISVGHSTANEKQLALAVKNKHVSCVTHVFNAMDKNDAKNKGIVGFSKYNKDLFAEMILDLKHVDKKHALSYFKAKGKHKFIIITDSMEARYMPDGIYKLGSNTVYVKNNQALLANGKKAGSVLTMTQALKNAKKTFNLSLEDTIGLVTTNIVNNLHLDKVGAIKQGY